MKKKEKLLLRLDEIGESVKNSGNALALFGLGSVGIELSRLDDYSDLDFFVIVKDGFKNMFIENLAWLSSITPLSYTFRNTKDGYKAMYEDGIYCEFAVFETHELLQTNYAEGRIVWMADGFDENLRVPRNTGAPDWKPESVDWLLGEIITCLYVGMCRYRRGEKLSGYTFIQRHAFTLFIELIEMTHPDNGIAKDLFAKDRRFEERYPGLQELLDDLLQGYGKSVESAIAMLGYLDKSYTVNPAMKAAILSLCKH
ncbi:MAG: hypothetical protein HY965_03050 [Ignavibacteriales bacterium]|nr:hypothetical protein [Ignavibacteriales bacterium]